MITERRCFQCTMKMIPYGVYRGVQRQPHPCEWRIASVSAALLESAKYLYQGDFPLSEAWNLRDRISYVMHARIKWRVDIPGFMQFQAATVSHERMPFVQTLGLCKPGSYLRKSESHEVAWLFLYLPCFEWKLAVPGGSGYGFICLQRLYNLMKNLLYGCKSHLFIV